MKPHLLIFLSALMAASPLLAVDRTTAHGYGTRSEVIAQHGMACTSQPLATQAALDILKQGGTAVDAAIAANAVLGLVEPTSNGLGGDLFALVWDGKTKKLYGLNASGRSPYGLTLGYFKKLGFKHIPPTGPLPVTVPGCVDGWSELHGKFGRLPLEKILAPAIGYARDGFPVSPIIAGDWQRSTVKLEKFPNFKETYMPNGRAPRAGEVFKNPGLARTLEKIAAGGRDAFYRGETAKRMAGYIQRQGGFLSEKDLAEHKSEWVEPVSTNYRGYEVWELPPNSQGIATLQMLNILEGYDLKSLGFGSPAYMHLFIEAKKLAFEDRAKFYADPDFARIPVSRLISKSYAAERRRLIGQKRASRKLEAGNAALQTSDTIYMTVADSEGTMVSLIQSNYRGMGSGMTPDGLGFIFQDRGELFSLTEGDYNCYAPHKRPFHTIIPAFVTLSGKPMLSFGVMGGDMQPQGHVQILVNLIDFGMGLQAAGDAPRIYHTGSSEPTGEKMIDGGIVNLESGFPEKSVRALVKMGHKIGHAAPGLFGGYQAILFDSTNKVYFGASEFRKDGQAAGW